MKAAIYLIIYLFEGQKKLDSELFNPGTLLAWFNRVMWVNIMLGLAAFSDSK